MSPTFINDLPPPAGSQGIVEDRFSEDQRVFFFSIHLFDSHRAPHGTPGDLFAGLEQGETDRGVQGARLNPLGLCLRTYMPFIWRILSACRSF